MAYSCTTKTKEHTESLPLRCPQCKAVLFYFSGNREAGVPGHYYCPECLDKAYDDEGSVITALV